MLLCVKFIKLCNITDNWAIIYAQKLAKKAKVPLCVCFCLVPTFLGATMRHYGFMLKGLQEVEKVSMFEKLNEMFMILTGIKNFTNTILSLVW